jgi:hypothetical protein
LPLILRESERFFSSLNLFIWNLGSSLFIIYLFYYFIYYFSLSFLFLFPSVIP